MERVKECKIRQEKEVDTNLTVCWDKPSGEMIPRSPRNRVPYPVTLYVIGELQVEGLLSDLSERGLMVTGVESQVDEIKMFAVIPDSICDYRPFFFEARCRWVKQNGDGGYAAGYSIEKISEGDLRELRNFIQALPLLGKEKSTRI